MRRRRGSFLRSLEEDCQIRRLLPRPASDGSEFETITQDQKVIILPTSSQRNTADLTEVIDLDNRYDGNLRPPNDSIRIGDQVVRSTGQVLTVTRSTTIRDVQKLDLEDRDKVVA